VEARIQGPGHANVVPGERPTAMAGVPAPPAAPRSRAPLARHSARPAAPAARAPTCAPPAMATAAAAGAEAATPAQCAAAAPSDYDAHPFTLAFRSAALEGRFLGEVAKRRWPVLMFVFLFDCITFTFRFAAKLAGGGAAGSSAPGEEGWRVPPGGTARRQAVATATPGRGIERAGRGPRTAFARRGPALAPTASRRPPPIPSLHAPHGCHPRNGPPADQYGHALRPHRPAQPPRAPRGRRGGAAGGGAAVGRDGACDCKPAGKPAGGQRTRLRVHVVLPYRHNHLPKDTLVGRVRPRAGRGAPGGITPR
jgi:hypothetical protein